MLAAASRGSIAGIEGAALHSGWLGDEALAAKVDPRVARTLARRAAVSASAYIKLIQRRNELARAMDERLALIDVLALPTTPVVAPLIEVAEESLDTLNRTDDILLRNPQVANQFDLTAISLPMPGMKLPGGLMLFARNGHDQRLFAIAGAVEMELARAR